MESNKPLSFNQWCEKFEVGARYIEPINLYPKNPSSGIEPMVELYETSLERFVRVLLIHLKGIFKIGR